MELSRVELKEPAEPIVFLMNFAGHDVSDAFRYSKHVVPLTEDSVNLSNTDRVRYNIEKKLRSHNYDPDRDYIAISGSPVLSAIIMRALTDYPKIKVLVFNAKTRTYYVRHI